MSFLEFVNAKYDELLEMMKSSKEERKALKDDNKILHDENDILKATIRSIESSLESITRANNDLEQYTRRECVEIRGIPVAATPSEEQTNNLVTDDDKLLGLDITQNDISVGHRMPLSQKHKGKPGPPAIIVKFNRRDVKDNFYRARKQLKDLTTRDLGYSEKNKIYLNCREPDRKESNVIQRLFEVADDKLLLSVMQHQQNVIKISQIHTYNTRLGAKQSYYLPKGRTDYGIFSIRFPGPSIWNSIDEDIKLSSSSLFKKKVKQQFIKDY
ncbi:hypothetical protein AWC38_SpisGene2053 [Stylophora pistillata]|uniref:Uncharacterized protein n=1 Tax=Stylophora pistillata TaxID=50429 RepID=A0A2B4ST16_STYPI|nr:hypothetical protein AWC38_SpisGene2053 [Stylophora pistillata]